MLHSIAFAHTTIAERTTKLLVGTSAEKSIGLRTCIIGSNPVFFGLHLAPLSWELVQTATELFVDFINKLQSLTEYTSIQCTKYQNYLSNLGKRNLYQDGEERPTKKKEKEQT